MPGGGLAWQNAAIAFYLAPLLAALTAGVAFWNLRRAGWPLRCGTSAVRAAAVGLAVLAVAGPRMRTETVRGGERIVATDAPQTWAEESDFTLSWPGDAPHAAAAVEAARATADPARTTDVVVDARVGDPGDPRLLEDALRGAGHARLSMLRTAAGTPPAPELLPAPRLVVPPGAVQGLPVGVELHAVAAPFRPGTARVLTEDGETTFDPAEGAWRTVLPALDLTAGAHRLIVEVPGRRPAAGFVDVAPPPRVTILGADSPGRDRLLDTLRVQGLAAGTLAGGDLGPQLAAADVFVLAPGRLTATLAARLAERVEQGAGLLALGGPWPRGLVRLRRSDLAPLLPVTIPPPPPPAPKPQPDEPPARPPEPERPRVRLDEGRKRALRVALLVCIDRSGSMAGGRLQMAGQAAIAAAQTLDADDRVAVVAFDDQAAWVTRFQAAADLRTLARRVGGLTAGGGTNFYPALKLSLDAIAEEPCGIRHVILLTDGATRPGVFKPMVEEGVKNGVTLSTIAIGDGADLRLLGLLASWGEGRMYPATDARRLPQVLTVDTQRFATTVRDERRKAFDEEVEGLPDVPEPPDSVETGRPDPGNAAEDEATGEGAAPRTPILAERASFLAGLEEASWPPLASPEDVVARTLSHIVLRWEDGGPALALGRAGLGRVAVLAADVTGPRATHFRDWDAAPRFLAQLVRSLAPEPAAGTERPEVTLVPLADRTAAVHVDRASGMLHLERVGGGAPLSVRCDEVAGAGFSLGRLDAMPAAGVWAGVYDAGGGSTPRVVAVSRGPAAARRPGVALDAARAAGVRIVDAPDAREPSPGTPEREPIEAPFLLGAAGLLLADTLLRRRVRSA